MKKELPFRIEEKEAFSVIGIVKHTTNQRREGTKVIPMFWKETLASNQQLQLQALMNTQPFGMLGINVYNTDPNDARKFDYYIACASDKEATQGKSSYVVPAHTWAIFPCKKDEIGKVEAQAITKWLPKSEYRPLNKGYITGRMKGKAPDIELYLDDEQAEVWVAVEKK